MIPWLDPAQLWFPDVDSALAEPPGLLAAGGDLSPGRLLHAYSLGIFPWYEQGQPILWWSPDPRAVLFPSEFRLRRSLRKRLRNSPCQLRFDSAFEQVVAACAAPRSYSEDTWITDEMAQAYLALHGRGFAHSVELWQERELVAGLYGVALDRVFFGESMFTRIRDGSKMALAALVFHLQREGYALLDCQMRTAHLEFMGSRPLPRKAFRSLLERHIGETAQGLSWRHIELSLPELAAWEPAAGGNSKLH